MTETFVLARRGLPLAGGVPSQPRAAWLPASARSPLAALPARATAMPAAVDEPAAESDAEWWDLPESQTQKVTADADELHRAIAQVPRDAADVASTPDAPGLANAAPHLADAHTDFAPSPGAPVVAPPPHQQPMGPPSASETDTTQRGVMPEQDTFASPHEFQASTSQRPVAPTPAAVAQVAPANGGSNKQRETSAARRDVSINTLAPAGDPPAQHLAAVNVTATAPPEEPLVARPPGKTQVGSQPWQGALPALQSTHAQRHVEAATPMTMGLPVVPAEPSSTPATASAQAPDISVLLPPAPAPQRSVFIDRVSITVQAPAVPPAPATPRTAPATSAPRGAATPSSFRNPWASYHLRRD